MHQRGMHFMCSDTHAHNMATVTDGRNVSWCSTNDNLICYGGPIASPLCVPVTEPMSPSLEISAIQSSMGLSCRGLRSLFLHFRESRGEAELQAVLAELQLPKGIDLTYLENEANWVGFDLGQRLVDALTEAADDPLFPRRAGLRVIEREVLGIFYGPLKAFGSPRLCYRQLLANSAVFNRTGTFELESITRSSLRMRYRARIPEPNRRFCEYRMGQFSAFPKLWGLPPARVVERQCQVQGADCCAYELQWLNRGWYLPRLAGGLAGGLAAAAVAAAARLPSGPTVWTVASIAVGALLGAVWEYRARVRQRDRLIINQSEDFFRSITSLNQGFEKIQELNRTLEDKVLERTRELETTGQRLKQALERQIELDQVKTDLITNINHDLRSPLTVITGVLTSMYVDRLTMTAGQQQLTEMGIRSANRLESMINDMLDLSRIDAGTGTASLQLSRVDLREVVEELIEMSQPSAQRLGLTLDSEIPESATWVEVDVGKIERVLTNLIVNACKYSRSGNEVTVVLSEVPGWVTVRVVDHGIGIAPDDRDRIFQRFTRGSSEAHRRIKGTGIGLAVVKEFVDLHGGRVEVESEVDRGSTFTISLPQAAAPSEGLTRAGDPPPRSAPRAPRGW